jgi:hypothetical protein
MKQGLPVFCMLACDRVKLIDLYDISVLKIHLNHSFNYAMWSIAIWLTHCLYEYVELIYSVDVKNEWHYTSTPPYAFMAWTWKNFTFTQISWSMLTVTTEETEKIYLQTKEMSIFGWRTGSGRLISNTDFE